MSIRRSSNTDKSKAPNPARKKVTCSECARDTTNQSGVCRWCRRLGEEHDELPPLPEETDSEDDESRESE